MKPVNPSEYPEFGALYRASQGFHCHMVMKWGPTYEIGPVCSRDHAFALDDLRQAAKQFLKTCEEPHGEFVCELMRKEYRTAKQELQSRINSRP